MRQNLKELAEFISKVNVYVAKAICYVLMAMLFTIMYDVVMRYLVNAPSVWSNEISQYLLVVISMLGGAYCLKNDAHVRVDILYHRLPNRYSKLVEILNTILILIVVGSIAVKGSILCYEAILEGKRSNTMLGFPMFPSMVMVPVGAFLLGLQAISNIITCLAKRSDTIDPKGKH